jgi:hypothetical protein
VLSGIFEHKRGDMIGGWRRLHSEDFHNLYSSENIIRMVKLRRMQWTGHVACMGDEKCVERRRLLRRPGHRWEEKLKWILTN